MIYSSIVGTGSYLPKKVLTNKELEQTMDTTDEWIKTRTGIAQRHIAADNETASMMAIEAAKKALEASNLSPEDLDLIIVATASGDYIFPACACLVQQGLNIEKNLIAFDVSIACAGFIYALSIADQFIKNKTIRHALVIGTEAMSRILDWDDRNTAVLFGDGAGAAVISASTEPGIIGTHLHAQGKHSDLLYATNGLPRQPHGERPPHTNMKGREVFKVAVNVLESIINEIIENHNITKDNIDWLIPHQANQRIIKAMAQKIGIDLSQVIITIDKHGNTTAASIPIALDIGIRDGRIKKGQTLLLEGFGAGFAWGSALIKY